MRRRALHALNFAVAIALAVGVVWTTRPWEVWDPDAAFVGAFCASIGLDAALVTIWAGRHALVLSAVGNPVPARRLAWLVSFSNAANNMTPAATGEIFRVWYLHREFQVDVDRGGAAILFERFFLFGLMVVTSAGAGLISLNRTLPSFVLAFVATTVYLFAGPPLFARLARRAKGDVTGGRIKKTVLQAMRGGIELWGDRSVTLLTAAWTLGAFSSMTLIFLLAAGRTGFQIDPFEAWALAGGATVVGIVSALPFGLGAAELSAVGIGTLLGLDTRLVAATFVLYRVFYTFPLACMGAVAYLRLTRGLAARSPAR